MTGARQFRLGERVRRSADAVLADARDPNRWTEILGGAWTGPRWNWTLPRPGSAVVTWADRPCGVSVALTGDLVQARAEITAVDEEDGCTVVADVVVSLTIAVPGAWWIELQSEVAPRWLRALTGLAPAGSDPAAG